MKSSSSDSSFFSYFFSSYTMILFFRSSSSCLLFIMAAPPNKSSYGFCYFLFNVCDWDCYSLPYPCNFFALSYFSFCFRLFSSSAFRYFFSTRTFALTSCKFFHYRFLYMYRVSSSKKSDSFSSSIVASSLCTMESNLLARVRA